MTVTSRKESQAASYSAVRENPFTEFPVHPTRKDRDQVYKEACDMATTSDVGYEWVGEFGLLSIVTVANKYMAITNKLYVELTDLPAYNFLINQ